MIVARLDRRHILFGNLKLATAAAAILILAIWGLRGMPWLALPLAVFIAAAVAHALVLNAKDRALSATAFYERGLARMSHEWMGRGATGDRFRAADHIYAEDLDLFGRGSLFELLSTSRTQAGEDTLAGWLLAPAPAPVIRARQSAVQELTPRLDLRESVAVLGDGVNVGVNAARLRAWATAPVRLRGAATRVGLVATVAMTATIALASAAARVPDWMLFGMLMAQVTVAWWFKSRVEQVIHNVEAAARDLDLLAGLLRVIETEPVSSPQLAAIQQALGGSRHAASKEIATLSRLVAGLSSRNNLLFAIPAALMLWATQFAFAIEAWRARVGPLIPQWLDAVGEFDALLAMAGYTAEHAGHVFPEIVEPPALVVATAMAHPLLPDTAVPNDVALGGDAVRLLIVSGSNMSGKSTLLRALGLNVVLAQAGAPVRATGFRLSPLAVGAAIRIQDSLQDGTSRFFAEIKRLKQIVDQTRASTGAALFLLDEILAGTNSHDRRHGAEALLTGLVDLGAVGLVTTHDLALGAIADRLPGRATNVHFEDRFEAGVLTFDFTLRPGVVHTSNAIALMQSIGLDV